MAAPVFNRQGFVGASMRDLIDATGLEKGGIYNHFGSKEQLALEAYDFAMSLRHRRARPFAGGATDAVDRLTRMIRSFAAFGPQARDLGRLPDHEHRDRSRRQEPRAPRSGPAVDDALAPAHRTHRQGRHRRRHARPGTDPYALASLLTASLEGASCSLVSTRIPLTSIASSITWLRTSRRCAPFPQEAA